jgi:hypothetical protein
MPNHRTTPARAHLTDHCSSTRRAHRTDVTAPTMAATTAPAMTATTATTMRGDSHRRQERNCQGNQKRPHATLLCLCFD